MRTRMWRQGLSGALLVAGLAGAVGAASWNKGNATGGSVTAMVNCGGIAGLAGSIEAWSTLSSGSSKLMSHADLGGEWNGEHFPAIAAPPQYIINDHYHEWTKSGGGSTSASTLQAEVTFSPSVGGQARRLNVPPPPLNDEWWWIPNVVVAQQSPVVQKFNSETGNWDDQNWTHSHGSGTAGVPVNGFQGSGGGTTQPETPTMSSNTTEGHNRASFTLPLSADGTQFRVKFPLNVTASASSDNALVVMWEEKAHVDCKTVVSTAAASSTEGFGDWSP
jgi:hypothetical protein